MTDAVENNENVEQDIRNQPKLIISSYKLNPEIVEAGSDFDLSITFYNTNNQNAIYNLKISLDQNLQAQPETGDENSALVSDGSVFAPINSSNTFYTSAIYPWNYVNKDIKMNVLPNAKAGSYVMGVKLEYEDAYGNQYTSTESIGIPVVQKAEITTSSVSIDDLYVGEDSSVSVDFYNTGKDNLSTFMVKVEGEGFTVDEDTRFIGNFNSGATENFSFNINPEQEGLLKGKILITYEDSRGKEHKEEKEFSKEVSEGADSQMGFDENGNPIETDPVTGEIIGQEDQGLTNSSLLTSPFVWIGLIFVIVLAIVLVNRRKKKKKNEELTIDED